MGTVGRNSRTVTSRTAGKYDPEYCVIHFTAYEATVYVRGDFETIAL